MEILRAPLVTGIDRKWALDQKPAWAVMRTVHVPVIDGEDMNFALDHETAGERIARLAEARKSHKLIWDDFVDDQIERFERFFGHERKTFGDWSRLWRTSWWPKADPAIMHPRCVPPVPQPFFRAGDPRFDRALAVATADERAMWQRFGVAQFKPSDPRLSQVAA